MTFYLKPADGIISTNLYQSYAECRLKYLTTLRKIPWSMNGQDDNANQDPLQKLPRLSHPDCVIDGTAKDRVSHFALRSIAILDPPLHSFVIQKEKLLFQKRLAKMTYDELKNSVMILIKQLREYTKFKDDHEEFFHDTGLTLHQILKKRFLRHFVYLNRECRKCIYDSDLLVIEVPFQHVLPLMAKREVQLTNGKAGLRCDQIPTYLTLIFTKILEYSSRKIQQTDCLQKIKNDPRFLELLPFLKQIYTLAVPIPSLTIGSNGSKLTIQTLDELSNYFPPCMKALHHTLRSRHRLCHTPRVQYTLYLKDVGLPVDDCLKLIRTEYSRPAIQTGDQKHKCEHSWDRDSRRYIYGTRHLYGLEGSRKAYSSNNCHTIQRDSPSPNECGGCPFVHFDDDNLQNYLAMDFNGTDISKQFISRIKTEKMTAIESCHLHLRFKSKTLIEGTTNDASQQLKAFENSQVKIHSIFKPKHYFALMSKVTEK